MDIRMDSNSLCQSAYHSWRRPRRHRLFPRDQARFFVGRVDAYEAGIVRVTGTSFVRDMFTGNMLEKADARTKLLSLSSGTLIVYLLPEHIFIDSIRFVERDGRLSLTNGEDLVMNLTEFSHRHKL
jgi:hypothetical protein